MSTKRAFLVALALVALPFAARADVPLRVVMPGELERYVDVRDVRSGRDGVTGQVVNRTDSVLENVRVVVEDTFLWTNERHPGDMSPGSATTAIIPSVPPHGAVNFTVERPEPSDRADGHFETKIQVVGLTERSTSPGLAQPMGAIRSGDAPE